MAETALEVWRDEAEYTAMVHREVDELVAEDNMPQHQHDDED